MKSQYNCPHCNNQLVNHHFDKIEEILQLFFKKIFIWRNFGNVRLGKMTLEDLIFNNFNHLLQSLNLIKVVDDYDRSKILNRSLVLLDEAAKHNIKIKPLVNYQNKYINYFQMEVAGRKYYFEGLPVNLFAKNIDTDLIDDKYQLKKFLLQNKMPVAEGGSFITKKAGRRFGQQLGYPLVVKPRDGSLSNHVTIKIANIQDLGQAIDIVKEFTNFYVVEKFIEGIVHRITIVGDQIFAARRLPANVVGDGQLKVSQLIEIKNNQSGRGEANQKNATLHKICLDQITIDLLSKQGYTLETVLASNQTVYLKDKVNLTSGCDIVEVSEQIHPENKTLFFRLAELLNTDILGIDYICRDLNLPYWQQESAIIECNSLPYIDMHHFPSQGQAQNVAGAIVELILKGN